LSAELDAGREAETDLKRQLSELQQRLSSLQNDAKVAEQKANEHHDKLSKELDGERHEHKESKNKSDAVLNELQKKYNDTLTDLAATKKQFSELQNAHDQLSNSNVSADSELVRARQRVKQLETEALGAAEAARVLVCIFHFTYPPND
jgi:chromosome segregation ATPase